MSKQTRLENFNNWPKSKLFDAEATFIDKLNNFKYEEIFSPCKIKENNDYDTHIPISYLLDMVDSLPKRPDHSFDWVWRAFEYMVSDRFSNTNTTSNLRKIVEQDITSIFINNENIKESFFSLVKEIPLQSCEYFVKAILNTNSFSYANDNEYKQLSPFAKRLLTDNGDSTLLNPNIQKLFNYLISRYNYINSESRRNAALIIKNALSGNEIENKDNNEKIKLESNDILIILLSGLGYSFRNDRAHAKSISPFRSSKATIKTYAHCWFMFLLIYEMLNICLLNYKISLIDMNDLHDNIIFNCNSYKKLFKNQISK